MLAPRQKEALTHQAHGLNYMETAKAMHCSRNNVANLLRECMYKLHALNTREAIAKAMHQGLIHLALVTAVLMGCGLGDDEILRIRYRLRQTGRVVRIQRTGRREELV